MDYNKFSEKFAGIVPLHASKSSQTWPIDVVESGIQK